jgi:hypothetical protein
MALDYLGPTLDEWRNTAHGALGHPDDTKRVQPPWDRAMLSGSAFEMETRMCKGDGTFRRFLNRFNPPSAMTRDKSCVGTLPLPISKIGSRLKKG